MSLNNEQTGVDVPSDSGITIKIDGEEFQIDLQDLTWGEAEEVEALIGGSIAENIESVKGVLALAFLAKRRKYPLCSLEELRALPMGAIEIVEGSALPPTQDGAVEDSGIQS